jgi:hypothetical protein
MSDEPDLGRRVVNDDDVVDNVHGDWRVYARALAEAGRVAEAEAVIMQHVDHIGAYAAIAQMHAARKHRLIAAGDTAGAAAAHEAARDWIYRYAGSATSGGEGIALSAERDQFLQQLGDSPLAAS